MVRTVGYTNMLIVEASFNPFPDDKKNDLVQIQSFCRRQNKCNTYMIISVFDTAENIVGKGENVGYQHFFSFSTMFLKGFFHITREKESLCENGLKQ